MDKPTLKPLPMTLQIVRSHSSVAGGGGMMSVPYRSFPDISISDMAFPSLKASANSYLLVVCQRIMISGHAHLQRFFSHFDKTRMCVTGAGIECDTGASSFQKFNALYEISPCNFGYSRVVFQPKLNIYTCIYFLEKASANTHTPQDNNPEKSYLQ